MGIRVHALILLAVVAAGVGASSASASARARRSRCVVPSVKGDKLVTARRRLRAAHCAAGRISGPRDGLVNGERPKPGRHGRTGAKVALTLKRKSTVSKTPGTQTAAPQPVGIPGNWKLVLDSEFDGTSLDTSVWHTGWFANGVTGPANKNEDDCYSPANVSLPGDGSLHLSVTATQSTCSTGYAGTYPFTGALISTNPDDGRASGGFQYTYGVLEARVYIPADGALIADWPAIWADGQSWPADGEDDLFEGLNGVACASFHDSLGVTRFFDASTVPGWHTFASDWEPGSVTFYYDGVSIGSVTTGVTSAPMFIVLDNTVHSGEAGVTEADSVQVQYVRVWQSQS